ncbi:MAG: hypothetical protein JWO60_3445 [Frankiales bacterium]|nr:hypothetical protein [Frankiales bacterium]
MRDMPGRCRAALVTATMLATLTTGSASAHASEDAPAADYQALCVQQILPNGTSTPKVCIPLLVPLP